jgi:hypothetical protein
VFFCKEWLGDNPSYDYAKTPKLLGLPCADRRFFYELHGAEATLLAILAIHKKTGTPKKRKK